MKTNMIMMILISFVVLAVSGQTSERAPATSKQDSLLYAKINEFAVVQLKTDLAGLTEKEKKMIPYLIEASKRIDDIYWIQAVDHKERFFEKLTNPAERKFAEINYGPWERLNGNKPFVDNFGPRPAGLFFYPPDMEKGEFEKWDQPEKNDQYSIIRRAEDGSLTGIPYHKEYGEVLNIVSQFLIKAAELAEDPGLMEYLRSRARAILEDDYFKSDISWMDMKNNTVDIVIGPIENYDDDLFGIRTSYEAIVLVKDQAWSKKLARFTAFLPELQKQLPVDNKYKSESPGTESDLNAYDAVYVAGQANAGSKTIAINLPNDETVQLQKGSRRLQLKNVMKAKFDHILKPISDAMIDNSQQDKLSFDAFFSNVMFHEVAHGLGIKKTISGRGTVREALKEKYAPFEEAKADILGLFMVSKLIDKGEIKDISKEQCYITYMAGLIRSVRFGTSSSHGKANMMCFNYFADKKAFERTPEGYYRVNMENFEKAMNGWAEQVLLIQGNGDYNTASEVLQKSAKIGQTLQEDLLRLRKSRIPVDIVYEQGLDVLGLSADGKEINKQDAGQKSGQSGKKSPVDLPKKPASAPVR